jgi:hypothetical protein
MIPALLKQLPVFGRGFLNILAENRPQVLKNKLSFVHCNSIKNTIFPVIGFGKKYSFF